MFAYNQFKVSCYHNSNIGIKHYPDMHPWGKIIITILKIAI